MIYLGADHNGYKLKEKIKEYLDKHSYSYIDLGAFEFAKDDDYPDFALPVARQVVKSKNNKGILLCGSGNGMAIAANKIKGARASVAWNRRFARLGVKDDCANILVLPAWQLSVAQTVPVVKEWLKAKPSSAGRHRRRVGKINKLGQKA